jgi:hypothetical protein
LFDDLFSARLTNNLLCRSDAPMNNSNPAFTSTKVEEMLMYFLQCTTPETKSVVTSVALPCSTGAPFPNVFSPVVGHNGYLIPENQPNNSGKINCLNNLVFKQSLVNYSHTIMQRLFFCMEKPPHKCISPLNCSLVLVKAISIFVREF